MAERRELSAARDAILNSRGEDLSGPFVAAFPVDGAAVSVLAGPASGSTVSSSGPVASRLDELQFDLGEGPCWTALAHGLPVLRSDIRAQGALEWPAFTEGVARDALTTGIASMFAFPLAIGALDIGALDLYALERVSLGPAMAAEATALAGLVAWQVLRTILNDGDGAYDTTSLGFSRREVHQATGMVLVQLAITAEEAEILLRAHAFSSGRSVADVARDVVERRLDFSATGDPKSQE
jgi:hypothetical protein